MGRGERETRGERRGRGERLSSGSRFVFPVLLLFAGLGTAPLAAQSDPSGFTIGLRASGVVSTRLLGDAIGLSLLPDTALRDRFSRDTIEVRAPLAPDLTLFLGVPLGAEMEVQLAAGYTFARLEVEQGSDSRDAGSLGMGHAVVSAVRPVRGVLARLGVGVLWLRGAEITALRDARTINPLLELAAMHRWRLGSSIELEAGLVGQATHLSSEAIEARQGPPGMVYRLGLEIGLARRLGR